MQQRAVILFAHGSRDPLWRQPIEAVAARMRALEPDVLVLCAYLELMQPDLPAALGAAVEAGARDVTVVPMFLGVGRHARHDLPVMMEALGREYPDVRLNLRQAIGENQRVLDLMAEIALS